MNTTIKNIFFRTLLCTILSLACVGVKAQTTYTVYFDNNTANWSGVVATVFINYSTENVVSTGNMTFDTNTGYYVYIFTTSEDMSTACCQFYDAGGSGNGMWWADFVNGAVYNENGIETDAGPDTSTWTFYPADGTSLTSLSSFSVTYSGGLNFNDDADDKTITVTCDGKDVDVYVQAGTIDNNSVTFTLVNSESDPTSQTLTDEGTYVITIPEDYFLLGDENTPSEKIELNYTISENKYTIYFDNTDNWSGVYVSVFYTLDWETYTYVVTDQQLYYDSSTGYYMLTFSSDTDLSTLSNVMVQFHSEYWSEQTDWGLNFVDDAIYSPSVIRLMGTYTFYFDVSSVWNAVNLSAVVYYTDDSGNKVYCLGSNDGGTVTMTEGENLYSNIYAWAFDTEIPEGKTANVEFFAWGDDEHNWSWSLGGDTTPLEFFNEHVYMYNTAHYPYPSFYYDEYYGNTYHTGQEVSTQKITHRKPKWSDVTDSSHDTFNKDVQFVSPYDVSYSNVQLQAANTYVDTIYVTKDSDIELTLPYTLGGGVAITGYQRWFDFRTDGNYRYDEYGDLLTPSISSSGINYNDGWNSVYRFANGYVCGSSIRNSNALISMNFHYPSDTDFDEYTKGSEGYMQQTTNDFYIVGCDLSLYTDAGSWATYGSVDSESWPLDSYSDGWWNEPTLAGRALYYIIGVDATNSEPSSTLPDNLQTMWKLRENGYSGGGDNYLEEYDIVFPARRTSNNTLELVTLSKDASSYIVPGVGDSPASLSAKIDNDNTTDQNFHLVKEAWDDETNGMVPALTGERRVLQFYNTGNNEYTNADNGAPWKVDDGTELTILVTKAVGTTTYNIARYHLTFKDDVTPLTQTQVARLDSVDIKESDYWWKDMTYRSSDYMKHNYDNIASLTFNYGKESDVSSFDNQAKGGFHYFPMDWENTSYAFYDGSTAVSGGGYDWYDPDATNQGSPTRTIYTQWCMYSLVNVYIGYGDSKWITETNNETKETYYDLGNPIRPDDKKGGDDDDYWLYIDASDRPGSVAEITFEDPICPGTQVFGTALIKSASQPTKDDAAVMFTIMGVKKETDGTETHTPIYRQCSSQIRMTTYLNNSDYGENEVDESGFSGDITGKGSEKNEWFQLYFSFLNSNSLDYDSYTFSIDNYCSSTSGGDYYIDDIQLYIVQPTFLVEQIAPVCTENVTSAVRLMVDIDMLEARLGDAPTEPSEDDDNDDTVDFMIVDMTKYYEYFSKNSEADPDNKEDIASALKDATVQFVYEDINGDTQNMNYATLKFYVDTLYSDYPKYDESNAGYNNAALDGTGYFYLYTTEDGEYLAIDCSADISPYKAYKILLRHDDGDTLDDDTYATYFAECISDACEIASDFYLTSSTILKVNGETVDPLVDYCAGQTVVIQPEVTYTADEEGNTTTLAGEYFDWFFGTEEEYTAENDDYEGVSLEKALLMFRHFYPTATELDESMKGKKDDDDDSEFTEAMYNIIAYYLEQPIEGSYYSKLVLYKQYLEVVIPTSELDLVVQPIDVVVYDEETGDPLEDVCFGYVPLMLNVGGNAPTFNAGFHNVEYPGDDFVPSIRLGLSQIKQASQAKGESNTETPIHVNLRNAQYYHEEGETESKVDHLGIYTTSDGTMDGLYLVGTNDPDPVFQDALSDEYFTQYDLPIGKVLDLYAIEYDTQGESYMKIAFYDEYTLREGYSYIVLVNCEEKDVNNVPVDNGACQGTLPIELKIVPEYLVWIGNSTSNWNNDSHWRRANKDELNKPDDDTYPTNEDNTTNNGFVPMLFTKVVIPEDSMACLYPAGFALENGQYKWNENNDASGSVTESLRDSIMYDLMVYDYMDAGVLDSMKTERYRVNLCSQLHLSSGAQMLHSELLLVDTVWTEVKIPVGQWQLVSTPLNNVYSGDWYTKTSGTETAEYFTDITFGTDNDRYDPDIYQRSWSKAGNIIVSTDSPTSSTNRDVPAYVSTGWTSAYNDASVEYNPGLGFSLEGWSSTSMDNIMFRFPKADTNYAYSNGSLDENHGTGTLLISEFVNRTEVPDNDDVDVYTGKSISVDLPENTLSNNEYYLVGNPFTAPMSMAQFMEENEDVKAYWAESPNGPIVGNDVATSDGYDDYILPPYTGFFITLEDNSSSSQISFTENMQVLVDANNIGPIKFSLRATSSKGATSACVAYKEDALDGYSLGEDVQLLEDDSWMHDGMPMVYTVAGDMAVSINTLSNATVIPIGAFADDDCVYTFQFTGVNNLNEPTLYDAIELIETPITEGYTLDLVGASHGRYFIRTRGTALGISEIENSAYDITAYSPTQGTIIVSSSLELENVEVYSVGGMLLNRVNAGGNISCTISGINSGVAIVRAKTSEGTFVKKIRVR